MTNYWPQILAEFKAKRDALDQVKSRGTNQILPEETKAGAEAYIARGITYMTSLTKRCL